MVAQLMTAVTPSSTVPPIGQGIIVLLGSKPLRHTTTFAPETGHMPSPTSAQQAPEA
jgi:hypothetical protein